MKSQAKEHETEPQDVRADQIGEVSSRKVEEITTNDADEATTFPSIAESDATKPILRQSLASRRRSEREMKRAIYCPYRKRQRE